MLGGMTGELPLRDAAVWCEPVRYSWTNVNRSSFCFDLIELQHFELHDGQTCGFVVQFKCLLCSSVRQHKWGLNSDFFLAGHSMKIQEGYTFWCIIVKGEVLGTLTLPNYTKAYSLVVLTTVGLLFWNWHKICPTARLTVGLAPNIAPTQVDFSAWLWLLKVLS